MEPENSGIGRRLLTQGMVFISPMNIIDTDVISNLISCKAM